MKAAHELLNAFAAGEGEPTVVRSGLQKLEGQIESGELGGPEDERFDLEYDENSMVLDFGVMLPELELAYDLAESNLPKKTLMVMDSVEALSERYGISSQRIMNTLQKDLVEHSGTNVVYVMEAWQNTELDYLGDGVVVLDSEERNGRRVRELIVEKLRGSRIGRWKYMFTLLNGRLRVFNPARPALPEKLNPHYPVMDPSSLLVSSGNESLDRVIGGFPRGGLTLIEVGKDVPQDAVRRLELCLVADFLSKIRGVVWFPLYSMNYRLFDGQMEQLVSPETTVKCLRVLHQDPASEARLDYLTVVEGSDASHDLKWNTLKYMLSGSNSPYLSLLGYDTLESTYDQEVIRATAAHLDAMRRLGNVIVAEATSSSHSLVSLANQANVHLKVESMAGTVMLCGEKPYTNYYNLDFRPDTLKPSLVPMV
jgi:hypothetical protein